ncbi:MAG: 1,4-beta-xylanase [Bacteroidetes bacterium]|nr:MAG: 1,4-beta-xylanase [Bacteroidota bacterium]
MPHIGPTKRPLLFFFFLFTFYFPASSQTNRVDSSLGLKDYFKDYFSIGVAVSYQDLHSDEVPLILKHFNSLTPENAMKMGPIHPKENEFNWKQADSIVDFAVRHGMKVRGHNLCWHEYTPSWLFVDSAGNQVTKQALLERLRAHINAVVGRYKGKIYAWDVVNEAVSDSPQVLLRNSLWYQIAGEDFIVQAFQYAHQADPNATLFYNDYNTERPEKMERVYTLMKKLLAEGVPVQGIGLQAHWSIYEPSGEELENAIRKFSSLGLKIQFTELDISIYPWEKFVRKKTETDLDQFTPALEAQQIEKYKMVFEVFRKNRDKITGITFWNVSDRRTWLDYYPVPGRKNYPLLFDTGLNLKKAFWKVVDFKVSR